MKVALIQMRSSEDVWENLQMVQAFVDEATNLGAELVCFPENVFYRGPRENFDLRWALSVANQQLVVDSPFAEAVAELVASAKLALSFGSIRERAVNQSRPYNSHFFFDRQKHLSVYRKIHLFDFHGRDQRYRESDGITPGSETVSVGLGDFQFGLSICYDLRFPELFRSLTIRQSANVLLVPSAFTQETGEAHWHSLLRARAIENLSYVLAPAQWGSARSESGRESFCYGHTLAFGPWGENLAEAGGEGDDVLLVELELNQIRNRREQLPVFHSIYCGIENSPEKNECVERT